MTGKEHAVLLAARDYAIACKRFNASAVRGDPPEKRQKFFNAITETRRELHLAAEALEDARLDLPERPLRLNMKEA